MNTKQATLGLACLFAGTLEYLTGRPPGSTPLFNQIDLVAPCLTALPDLYGKLGSFVPDFFHPLAFSLMFMAFVESIKARISICIFWVLVDVLFEVGQKNGVEIMTLLSAHFEAFPLLRHVARYFANGTFDSYDLIAIGMGGVTAFVLGELSSGKGGGNELRH